MRKFINIVNQSLNEARFPRRPIRRGFDEPLPEPPEETLHGDLGDDISNIPKHFNNLNNVDFGADEMSDDHARMIRGAYPHDEEFGDFLHRKQIETGIIFPTLWRQLKQMPAHVLNNIRQIGRSIFGRLTDTPLEEIFTLSTVFGDDDEDVRRMIEWLQKYGVKQQYTPYDFSNVMPGYKTKELLYNVDEYQFLIVRDAMGSYIYAWKNTRM